MFQGEFSLRVGKDATQCVVHPVADGDKHINFWGFRLPPAPTPALAICRAILKLRGAE